MSLIISVFVPAGIVISGDSRTTREVIMKVPDSTPQDPNAFSIIKSRDVLSDATEKVFLIHERFGVGIFGDAIVNDTPVAEYFAEFQAQAANASISTDQIADDLLLYFRRLKPVPDIRFVVAGYDAREPWVIAVYVQRNAKERENIDRQTNTVWYGMMRGGETAIVDRLMSVRQLHPPYEVMNRGPFVLPR